MKRRIREFHVTVVSDGKDWSTKNNVLACRAVVLPKKPFAAVVVLIT